jgi:hypothetical protein
LADPKHLLYNLKWRLEALEVAMANVTFLMYQIKTELEKASKEQSQ